MYVTFGLNNSFSVAKLLFLFTFLKDAPDMKMIMCEDHTG